MSRYSKAIGAVVGGVVMTLAAMGFIPEDLASEANIATIAAGIGAIATIGAAIATYAAPKNKE